MSESDPNKPARNMADIARLFLDGARPAAQGGMPKRIAPSERVAQSSPRPIAEPIGASWEMPELVLGIGAGRDSWKLLENMAAGLAEDHATTVCLLGMRDGQFIIQVAGSESPDDLPRITPGGGSPDMQIARMLFTMRDCVGHWIIAAPDASSSVFAKLGAAAAQWILACAANNEGVVAAYQQIKRAVSQQVPTQTPRCYMISDDYAEASLIHSRLRAATAEFLKQELPLAGAGFNCTPCHRVAAIPASDPADIEALWIAVIDELCAVDEETEIELGEPVDALPDTRHMDVETALEHVSAATEAVTAHSAHASAVFDQLAHVLDPEERAALGADLPDLSIPSPATEPPAPHVPTSRERPTISDIRKQVTPPAQPLPPLDEPAAAPTSSRPTGPTLRAFDLLEVEDTRTAQWEAVERSIRDLVTGSTLLEARPPMSWATDCCLAIDANGHLHVWTLYKDGVSWFALREWASEHRNLLALTRRDLVLNREADVTVHIILPLDPDTGSGPDIKSLLRTPSRNVFIYRLRSVQWNGRRGILVVPIA